MVFPARAFFDIYSSPINSHPNFCDGAGGVTFLVFLERSFFFGFHFCTVSGSVSRTILYPGVKVYDAQQNVGGCDSPSFVSTGAANEPYERWSGMDRRSKEYKALKEERADALWKVGRVAGLSLLPSLASVFPVADLACMLGQLCRLLCMRPLNAFHAREDASCLLYADDSLTWRG